VDKYIGVMPGHIGVSRLPCGQHIAAVDNLRSIVAHEKHLYLKCSGDYVPSTLPGEIWEVGIRLALVFGTVDDIGLLPSNWDPVADTISRVETNWTISGNWKAAVGASVFQPDDYLNDQAAPALTNFLANAVLSNQVRLRTLSLYPAEAPDAHTVPAVPYVSGTPCVLSWTSAYPTGGEGGTQLPPQDSVVVSWRTLQVGKHGRGRIFLPSSSSTGLSQAHVSSAAQTDITDAAVTLCEELAYTSSGAGGPHVRPIVTGAPYENYGTIIQAKVGNYVDTQRRRRNRLVETYTTGNITY
jgi:hypothetical protein